MNDDMRPTSRPTCPRTKGFIERIARDASTAADLEHAAGCASCGPVLATAARFDDALRRSARGLVSEQMPHGILDPALLPDHGGTMGRRALPNFAGILAAVVIMVMASSLGILPGGPHDSGGPNRTGAVGSEGPSDVAPTPAPTGLGMRITLFRFTVDVIDDLRDLGYYCFPGKELSGSGGSFDPQREGVACKPGMDVSTYSALVTTRERGEGDAKEVVEVAIEGSLSGTNSAQALEDLAQAYGKLSSLVFTDRSTGQAVAAWLVDRVPTLKVQTQGDEAEGVVRDVQISLMRHPDGRYYLLLAAARP